MPKPSRTHSGSACRTSTGPRAPAYVGPAGRLLLRARPPPSPRRSRLPGAAPGAGGSQVGAAGPVQCTPPPRPPAGADVEELVVEVASRAVAVGGTTVRRPPRRRRCRSGPGPRRRPSGLVGEQVSRKDPGAGLRHPGLTEPTGKARSPIDLPAPASRSPASGPVRRSTVRPWVTSRTAARRRPRNAVRQEAGRVARAQDQLLSGRQAGGQQPVLEEFGPAHGDGQLLGHHPGRRGLDDQLPHRRAVDQPQRAVGGSGRDLSQPSGSGSPGSAGGMADGGWAQRPVGSPSAAVGSPPSAVAGLVGHRCSSAIVRSFEGHEPDRPPRRGAPASSRTCHASVARPAGPELHDRPATGAEGPDPSRAERALGQGQGVATGMDDGLQHPGRLRTDQGQPRSHPPSRDTPASSDTRCGRASAASPRSGRRAASTRICQWCSARPTGRPAPSVVSRPPAGTVCGGKQASAPVRPPARPEPTGGPDGDPRRRAGRCRRLRAGRRPGGRSVGRRRRPAGRTAPSGPCPAGRPLVRGSAARRPDRRSGRRPATHPPAPGAPAATWQSMSAVRRTGRWRAGPAIRAGPLAKCSTPAWP